MEDIRQTREWAGYLHSCGWMIDKVDGANVFIKKIPLTPFAMMKVQRFSKKLKFNDLNRVKKKHRVAYTVLEPDTDPSWQSTEDSGLFCAGFRINKRPFLPTKSIVVDLDRDERQLYDDLSTNTKRILNKNTTIRMNVLDGEEGRKKFYRAWKKASKTWVMGEKRFNCLLDAFGKKASLWVSEDKNGLLSGVLLLESEDTSSYFQTWTGKEGRGLGAHYNLVWKVILESKRKGLRWFDFEGIADERWPQKKWAGFSEFKKKFGGRTVTYPGSFVKWF